MAARSPIDICNLALTRVGARRISSFDGTSEESGICRIHYAHQRDMLLRDHNWSFALARASLPEDSDKPAYGYEHKFQLPADCSRLVEVGDRRLRIGDDPYDHDPQADYIVEGRSILTCRCAPLKIRYIRRVLEPELWDDSFVDVVVAHLAASIVMPLTQKAQLIPLMQQEARTSILRAARANALELAPVALPTTAAITERY